MQSMDRRRGSATTGNASTREQLLDEHLGLVHEVARRISRQLSADIGLDYDEMVSVGTLGLIQALDAFDASRGLAFSTYAIPRIRGAILDEVRRQDRLPRSVRRKAQAIDAAREKLTRAHGHPPTDPEIAQHLGIDPETLCRWQAKIDGSFHLPLEQRVQEHDTGPTFSEIIPDERVRAVDSWLVLEEEVGSLRVAITTLKEQERIVLTLCYFEELRLREIATVLGLTESRVSQIRSQAIRKLRARMPILQ